MTIPEWLAPRIAVDERGCWLWKQSQNGKGYAIGRINGKTQSIHRWSYSLAAGPIPDGMQLDHLCRVRHCVNPAHLEPVTSRANTFRSPITIAALNAAKTHCKRGHEFTPENTRVARSGSRCCRECAATRRERIAS